MQKCSYTNSAHISANGITYRNVQLGGTFLSVYLCMTRAVMSSAHYMGTWLQSFEHIKNRQMSHTRHQGNTQHDSYARSDHVVIDRWGCYCSECIDTQSGKHTPFFFLQLVLCIWPLGPNSPNGNLPKNMMSQVVPAG